MELYRFFFFLIMYGFFGYLFLCAVACCLESYNNKKKEILKELRQEVNKLLVLKQIRQEKTNTTNEALKLKVRDLQLRNKALRKTLHQVRVEKNLLKKGKK